MLASRLRHLRGTDAEVMQTATTVEAIAFCRKWKRSFLRSILAQSDGSAASRP
ncbi:hypothetical protein S7335_579 [Synechococcus sp. PCC 7335]|nr:hypothetical protein S7335_579 [Synechococcus sp. PCC 7335]